MTTHLRRHHPLLLNSTSSTPSPSSGHAQNGPRTVTDLDMQPVRNHQSVLPSMFNKSKIYDKNSVKAQNITQSLTRFIIKDLRPYRMVESPEFKDFVHSLDPRYSIPSRKTMSEVLVPKAYQQAKGELITKLRSASQVALTTDGWTSRNTESFVTITVCFINDQWKMENFVLQTRPLPESHTAENIAQTLRTAVVEWGLPLGMGDELPPIVSDNAANMVKAASMLNTSLYFGCFAHTINLAVQKSLKIRSASHLLARIRRIVAFFHRSSVAAAVLKAKAELLELKYLKLKTDIVTRWNSAYDMVKRYLDVQTAVVAALRSKELSYKRKSHW